MVEKSRRLVSVLAASLAVSVLVSCQPDTSSDGTTPTDTAAPRATTAASTPNASPSAVVPPALDTRFLATLTTYPKPGVDRAAAPAGYQAVFTEHVGRHGSRSLTSDNDGDRALKLWRQASAAGALTSAGADFGPAVEQIVAAMDEVGYGNLSTLGRTEQRDLGIREGKYLKTMFAKAVSEDDDVAILTSGRGRAVASAEYFVDGLESVHRQLEVRKPKSDPDLLYFDTTDPDYKKFISKGKTWRAAYQTARATADIPGATEKTLRKLYSRDFVQSIDDPEGEAEAVWELYRVAAPMVDDAHVDMSTFMDPEVAAAFAFKEDARYFYSRGPGVTGDDRSYKAAGVLLDDFFDAIDRKLAGGKTVAVFRFAHAEEIVPFAALLELPGSTQLASRDEVFSWDDSAFRTAQVAPLSANISWTLWQNSAGHELVSITHNEVPTAVGRSCRVADEGASFYELTELKRCLSH